MFVWNNGKGHKLTSAPYFCQQRKIGCAIYSKPYATCVSYLYNAYVHLYQRAVYENKKIYFKMVYTRVSRIANQFILE